MFFTKLNDIPAHDTHTTTNNATLVSAAFSSHPNVALDRVPLINGVVRVKLHLGEVLVLHRLGGWTFVELFLVWFQYHVEMIFHNQVS
jgi:hypothetical protein